MAGSPCPLSLERIFTDLFQNQKLRFSSEKEQFITFSKVVLTKDQTSRLTYPEGYEPLNIYLLQQVDDFVNGTSTTQLKLTSFVKKGDQYIYGFYFTILNQPSFSIPILTNSKQEIMLAEYVQFVWENYLEVYNDVIGTGVILGFSTNPYYASLQFSHCNKYYYQSTNLNGVLDPNIPKTHMLGLSKNIKLYLKNK